ncbi:MAG TPA: flagellar hook capping FlgD N-terminal domain-containing protein [Acidobacteriaceae bacterium]|jgi:flagellar basal-body rod modification protein FlgD|nr:flagellar hook capping FlgD N-terminal domain-containing protein [Acidobacteriaceae bacterium]
MNVQGFSPQVSAPLEAQTATTTTGTTGTSGSSGTGSGALSSSDLQSTFLNLLVTELQNQDPTAPVDPTEMVGQMVSLNQLDQLISMNQTLSSIAGTSTNSSTSGTTPTTGTSQNATNASATEANANAATTNAAATQAASLLQPAATAFNTAIPGGLMNLYGNVGVPAKYSTTAIPGGR